MNRKEDQSGRWRDQVGAQDEARNGRGHSYKGLEAWLQEAAKFGGGDVPLVVCANKVDKRRAVSEAEGRAWAEGRGFPYFETSAESGANVSAAFEELFKQAWQQVQGARR